MAFQNFYSSKISNDIGAGDVTITVDNAPTATAGRMTLEARNSTQREIIKYTGVAGNVLTGVTRGQGGTTAKSHLKGALIQQNATAEDLQDLYDAFASFAASATDWRSLVPGVSSVSYLGNRSYQVTFGSTVAALLSPGMRWRSTRTTSSPTQCTSLNGTTQYYNRASGSVSGMTFTDDATASAWVKLTSYANPGVIISRQNGTSGFQLDTVPGAVRFIGYNAGAGNYSLVQSYQSVPLNKWVHVSALLDMSAFTALAATAETAKSWVMFDGVEVPASVSRAGTNPTALVQAGNLEIGSSNGGTALFPGKIAQVAIYSTRVTQANIRATISQGLTGAETSLISAYSFNNSINDLNTTNNNHLTANGSAVATNADSPFGGQADGSISANLDYAIVQTVATTVAVVQVPEGNTIPTAGAITSSAYTGVKAPYGMPVQRAKWRVICDIIGQSPTISIASSGASTAYPGTSFCVLAVPIGEWKLVWEGYLETSTSSITGNYAAFGGLWNVATAKLVGAIARNQNGANTNYTGVPGGQSADISVAAVTQYTIAAGSGYTGTGSWYTGNIGLTTPVPNTSVYAENGYL